MYLLTNEIDLQQSWLSENQQIALLVLLALFHYRKIITPELLLDLLI